MFPSLSGIAFARMSGLATAFLVALALAAPALAQESKAQVRVAHLSPDAPSMDVHIDDKPIGALTGVSFKTVSDYLSLAAGDQSIEIYPAGNASKPIARADLSLQGGESYTIGVVGLVEDGSLAAQIYEDDNSRPDEAKARLRVIHAAPDVEAVDIAPRGGKELFADLGFPNATGYAEVPAGTYTLDVTTTKTHQSAFVVPDASVSAGTVYSVFAVGQARDGTLGVIVSEDAGASSGPERAAFVDVVPGTAATPTVPADNMPHTGGISPLLLPLSGMALIAAGGTLARLGHRKSRTQCR